MKRLYRCLLPVLTCLVVLAALFLPPRLSRWRDRTVLDGPHTETLKTENNLPTQSLSLEERILLLTRYYSYHGPDNPELTAIFQELEQNDAAEALIRAELEQLVEAGVLPPIPLSEPPAEFHLQRCYLRAPEELRGATFLMIDCLFSADEVWFFLVLDEETGRILRLRMLHPDLPAFAAEPLSIGSGFLKRLGLEYRCDQYDTAEAEFTLVVTGCRCTVNKMFDNLHLTLWTEESSAPVEFAG